MKLSEWYRSRIAYNLFSYAAWVIVYAGVFICFMLTPWFSQIESRPIGLLILRIIGTPAALLGVPAALVIFVGMIVFILREDRSPTRTKALWFLLFFWLLGLDRLSISFPFTGSDSRKTGDFGTRDLVEGDAGPEET